MRPWLSFDGLSCRVVPHHLTQRGNRRQPVFFGDDDYRLYVKLLGEYCLARMIADTEAAVMRMLAAAQAKETA